MYGIAVVVLAGYLALGLLSRRVRIPEEVWPETGINLMKPFYRMGYFLVEAIGYRQQAPVGKKDLQKQIEMLNPHGNTKAMLKRHMVSKSGMMLAILFLGTVFGCLVKLQNRLEGSFLEGNTVYRGDYTQKSRELSLEAVLSGTESQSFQIKVEGQMPGRGEADQLEAVFWEALKKEILGENPSLEEVWTDLNLVTELEAYPFFVEWKSLKPQILDVYGWIAAHPREGEKETLELEALVTLGEWEWEHVLQVTVVPVPQTEAEKLHEELQEYLERQEALSRQEAYLELPSEWQGESVRWQEKREDNGLLIWGLGLGAALAVFFLADRDVGKKLETRQRQIQETYPTILNKLVLYLGAGMNVRGALFQITEHYSRHLKAGGSRNPGYEELLFICRELQAGVSEASAYEILGRRSGVQEFVRLSAILSQNLKKGNGALLERLREEADRTRREQTNHYRQAGEMASTKLLVPMVMMLGVVMVMIMIPAFGAF